MQNRFALTGFLLTVLGTSTYSQPAEDPFLVGIDILNGSPCLDVIVLVENSSNGRTVNAVELNAVNHYLNGFAASFSPNSEDYLLATRSLVFERCLTDPSKSLVEITRELGREKVR
jgi:hypothetical protein